MLTVLTNIRSTKVLHHASCIMHHRLALRHFFKLDKIQVETHEITFLSVALENPSVAWPITP